MRNSRSILLIVVPLLFAFASVLAGKDQNWDFLNYRWYNAWAFLHDRLTMDVLVAHHATFYNPLLELPFYLAATCLPAVVAGFLLALAGSIVFVPLYLLTEQVLPALHGSKRILVPAAVGLAGLLGGGVLGQIGIVSWDLPLATLTLFALWLLVRDEAACLRFASRRTYAGLVLAGVLAGLAAGLKLTAAVYPVGLVTGIFFASALSLSRRVWQASLFSAGTCLGLLLGGGYWMARLYTALGNPFFPYFNGLFHSAYAAVGSNRDTTFLPQDWRTALFFPYYFSANSHHVAEYDFRDVHLAMLFTLLPLLALRFWRRPDVELANNVAARLLLISAVVSYVAWEALFSIYRYILPLEALAPLLIVVIVASLPIGLRARTIIASLCLLTAVLAIRVDFTRSRWDAHYVAVRLPFAVPDQALVLMTGDGPMGYAVTALPPTVPVLRISSYLATGNRFAKELTERIADHTGPFYVMVPLGQEAGSQQALAAYQLVLDKDSCGVITSNVAEPVSLCRANRATGRLQ